MRRRITFCDGWEFALCSFGTDIDKAEGFAPVDIPHDWLIYDTNDLYKTSTGWYRKRFTVQNTGLLHSLHFDGVYMDCKVYINGTQAFEWKYGYTSFDVDISRCLHEGENEVTVRVDHQSPNSRWYSGAGIYRKVYLDEYEDIHFLNDGIYISADDKGNITLTAETERPQEMSAYDMRITVQIFKKGEISDSLMLAEKSAPANAADKSVIPSPLIKSECRYTRNDFTLKIDSPKLWDINDPQLYTAVVRLYNGDRETDCITSDFGFRKCEFTPDRGFFLNGRHVKIHGVCEHHDLGALGAAVNKYAIKRKLSILSGMGVNAIRTSHNPPAPELLQLCDEMGFLVLDEGFDMWERHKTEFDYARFFDDWIERDVCSWVRRDRNHPCVIGWSIGNEIYDTHADDRGQEVTSLLKRLVSLHDPRGNGVITIGSNYMQWENAGKCADILKVAGYNYAERLYSRDHARHPDWAIYGSETSSVVQSRGIYHFPLSERILCDDDEQCSALGNSSPAWAAPDHYACIIPDRDAPYCAGQFVWTGFDYIGEPTPYSTKNSYFGQIDTAGFPKDSYYMFKGEWTSYKNDPFIHIFPYWDHNEGQDIDIRVVSNAPFIRLFLNGELIGEKSIDHDKGTSLVLDVQHKYLKGTLTAAAYDENGSEIARDEKCSFDDAAALVLTPDKTKGNADGEDIFFIEISAADKNGIAVFNANNRVNIEVTGEGRLIGLDNGDSTDYDQYKCSSRRLFSGKLLAMVAATKTAGNITVKAASAGLEGAEVTLETISCDTDDGISAAARNTSLAAESEQTLTEIPVRKIEIISDSDKFTKDCDTLTFKVKCRPENATYKDDITYRLTTVSGIDSILAEIVEQSSDSVTVKCKGDGGFYLRALCKNGRKKPSLISIKELSAEGLGQAAFDPYSFVAGGLFSRGRNVSAGIERGMGFSNDESYAAFDNVDFGSFGSDTVFLQMYMLGTTPVDLTIYDGTPEDGEVIGEYQYLKTSPWLTYNDPEPFRLTKTLTGVHTISFAAREGYEIKGFRFKKPDKEFAEIPAVSCANIYGDSFEVNADDITHIGNNVVIEYGSFDFTNRQPTKLIITGRSLLDMNSIHFKFTTDKTELILLGFEKSEEYTERSFDISGISGEGKVSFTFLPGSDLDFKAFRFE
ncbi:MAG: DUF4982 domain-containing protein [Ruminococcus sp.]|nr:DUF4982 domain-containing protein [Ruminococcus sp.]